jgi:TPR repeat protein
MELKTAYTLTYEERFKEAAVIYMELAEQGLAVAQLNAAILFDKYDIFDNEKVFISELVEQEFKRYGVESEAGKSFNINKHLAYKYFQMAALQRETEDEANLKLGDFYYYG